MNAVKGIPYGVARFEDVRNGNFYYVDKTMYLPLLEDTSNYLFLIRPRRFGKSVFVSMMQAYYDIAKADKFDRLFNGLWIYEHPTPLKNAFQVIYFDFSLVGTGGEGLEANFDFYCGMMMDSFIDRYKDYYGEAFCNKVLATSNGANKMKLVNEEAHKKGYPLYLIIDEYDNFTNVILSEGGKDVFRNLTHASGFYREYFKLFKAMFSRVFLHLARPALQRYAGLLGERRAHDVPLLPRQREAACGSGYRGDAGRDEALVQQLLFRGRMLGR